MNLYANFVSSFSDRILVGKTRQQLLAYAKKGLDDEKMEELKKLIELPHSFPDGSHRICQ